MKFSGIGMRRKAAGIAASGLLGGFVAATLVTAPAATAAPDCSASGVANTMSTVTGQARDYLNAHPGANQAVTTAKSQSRPDAEANLRGYFTANPQEYYDLRGILSPIGDTQRTCNVQVLPPDLESAYSTFMAG